MRTSALLLSASLSFAALTAAGEADACACRVGHHHTAYRHVGYVRHYRTYASYYRPHIYSYPVYYDDYAYDPSVYRRYYDWTYEPGVWVSYGGAGYGWYDGGSRWRRHHPWRRDWAWEDRGRWHDGGRGHWDHGRHRGWG